VSSWSLWKLFLKPYEATRLLPLNAQIVLQVTSFGLDSVVATIAEALKVNSVLQDLALHYTEIGDSGAAAIADVLKVNASLQNLNLGNNEIGASGAAALAEALKVNSALQEQISWATELERLVPLPLRKHSRRTQHFSS
jgi:hypothetical protein